jgi:hypothetical protein
MNMRWGLPAEQPLGVAVADERSTAFASSSSHSRARRTASGPTSWAEDLVAGHPHGGGHAGQDRRRDVEAVGQSGIVGQRRLSGDVGAFGHADPQVIEDLILPSSISVGVATRAVLSLIEEMIPDSGVRCGRSV